MFDFFKPAAAKQPEAQTQNPSSASGQNTPSTQDPAKQPGTEQLPPNPLDVYAKLWENTNQQEDAAPSFNLDPKVLGEVSSSMDFTRNVSPELMQKATGGDMNAMMQLMNHVGREAYQASLSHGATLTDKFVGARSKFDQKAIGSSVKAEMVSSSFSDIPNSSHPAVKTELKRIAEAMQKQNPDARPDQIVQATKDYFNNVFSAIQNPQAQQKPKDAETDWDKYFN